MDKMPSQNIPLPKVGYMTLGSKLRVFIIFCCGRLNIGLCWICAKTMHKVCGCDLVCFSCSPTYTYHIYTTKFVLHQQTYDETCLKSGLKNQISLDLVMVIIKMHVCWFLECIHKSSHMCSLLSVDQLLIFEDVVQNLSDICLYDVCSLIVTEPHTNQVQEPD